MQIQTFILKIIINERKILTHYDIINSIEEKIVSVITQVYQESKLWNHSNLRRPNFSFTYSLSFLTFAM